MEKNAKNIEILRSFRRNMGAELTQEMIEYIFEGNRSELEPSSVLRKKIDYVKENINRFMVLNWVKFIAVTGSYAAGTNKKKDDIDLFIVVKNDRMWLYRGLMAINPFLRGRFRRKSSRDLKDTFCLNLISEERGLTFESDIFNFHELYFMRPVYNSTYMNTILIKNAWVRNFGGYFNQTVSDVSDNIRGRSMVFRIIETIAFLSQLLFMVVTKHKPDIKRLLANNRKGRIEFFDEGFKENVLEYK
ncbi:MAG: hypothetical protein UT34_C0002G0092 [candidate division WS6 bacterium GW2011_GWF2_39_15]|uniref:Polymerase nucleotidyl transferase domain-containing protein n=1 Tax=candidate division WS6 bacterium GW2011_GWF2_39_15 TaxID=1619100 RepID=A0A0G0Q5C3_9BACT|nr:MAG: hypothetical protein UT34_C0002G0092 [candidate division WS6 bacterium GW2011_GWF2_39_15]